MKWVGNTAHMAEERMGTDFWWVKLKVRDQDARVEGMIILKLILKKNRNGRFQNELIWLRTDRKGGHFRTSFPITLRTKRFSRRTQGVGVSVCTSSASI